MRTTLASICTKHMCASRTVASKSAAGVRKNASGVIGLPFFCGTADLVVAVRLLQLQSVQLPATNINPVFYPSDVVPETSPLCLTKVFVFIENGE